MALLILVAVMQLLLLQGLLLGCPPEEVPLLPLELLSLLLFLPLLLLPLLLLLVLFLVLLPPGSDADFLAQDLMVVILGDPNVIEDGSEGSKSSAKVAEPVVGTLLSIGSDPRARLKFFGDRAEIRRDLSAAKCFS